ncbi:hypothetical protein CTRC69_02395 [Chlamydia trachomatis RC-F/69]|nr:hypothetical protein E150_02380 [Chlamydia trachomatis E/150]ADH18152.1 hypothetical protein G9768_02350 [Chlamydia trachomatis G/9768]ADH19075.1 hypothetical protein G11222_02355 [Chlamydia trachomatis G/11222]ADH20000.1 hypothetical protein G11074_02355 [Chlamydia trachomatis G/11074]ADH20924.1 hypothetical protein E11023_02365 [Chlamydia trachomatis E/11023]ADH97097.1 hypothetical protein CTG9301_02360 [Chlamydia trachomatis G/9301]AGR93879.1 hypothetical protein CTRC69_02395 [Chlamydia
MDDQTLTQIALKNGIMIRIEHSVYLPPRLDRCWYVLIASSKSLAVKSGHNTSVT